MKRLLLVITMLGALGVSASAQVMKECGVENTSWIGLGVPFSGDFCFYGLVDCLEARMDIWHFTIEGMLNWGILTDWDDDGDFDGVWFGNTSQNAMSHHYYPNGYNKKYDNTVGNTNLKKHDDDPDRFFWFDNAVYPMAEQPDHRVNLIWHILEETKFSLDVGVGTELNWGDGPAPGFYCNDGNRWQYTSHIRQGGFSSSYNEQDIIGASVPYHPFNAASNGNRPGSADVVGYVHYANIYAKKAIAMRFGYGINNPEGFGFEVGASIPQDTHTDKFAINLAGSIRPVPWLTIATDFEGLFHKDMNWYLGVGMQLPIFGLDVYFAWDNMDADSSNDTDPMAWSLGLAFSIKALDGKMLFRPEAAINWFENGNWTPAWYVGLLWDWNIVKIFEIDIWASFAMGSMDTRWDDYDATDDWDGGNIFNVRPDFSFHFDDHHTLSIYADLEGRKAFDGKYRFGFTTGIYWTFKFLTGKMQFAKDAAKTPPEPAE